MASVFAEGSGSELDSFVETKQATLEEGRRTPNSSVSWRVSLGSLVVIFCLSVLSLAAASRAQQLDACPTKLDAYPTLYSKIVIGAEGKADPVGLLAGLLEEDIPNIEYYKKGTHEKKRTQETESEFKKFENSSFEFTNSDYVFGLDILGHILTPISPGMLFTSSEYQGFNIVVPSQNIGLSLNNPAYSVLDATGFNPSTQSSLQYIVVGTLPEGLNVLIGTVPRTGYTNPTEAEIRFSCNGLLQPGTYTVKVQARALETQSGVWISSDVKSITVVVSQPNYSVWIGTASTNLVVNQGESTQTYVAMSPQDHFPFPSRGIEVLNTLPQGMTISSDPDHANNIATGFWVNVACTPYVVPGIYLVKIHGTRNGVISNAITLTVNVNYAPQNLPRFSFIATKSPLILYRGTTDNQEDLVLTPLNGFNGVVQVSEVNPPVNLNPVLRVINPTSVNLDSGIAKASNLQFTIPENFPTGKYTLPLIASSGSMIRRIDLPIIVRVIPTPLGAPTTLIATSPAWNEVNLSWDDNSTEETGFKIFRKKAPDTLWTQIATVGAGVVAYQDKPVEADTAYEYRVCAYNTTGNSPDSNTAYVTTLPDPGPTVTQKGSEFWLAFPSNWPSTLAAQKALSLTILGPSGTQGVISGPGMPTVQNFTVPASGSLVVTVPTSAELTFTDSIQAKGIRIVADNIITVHAFNHARGGTEPSSEGYLVLPKTALGTEYVGVSLVGDVVYTGTGNSVVPATLTVLGVEDESVVSITPSHTVTVLGTKYLKGIPFTVNLNKGEIVQIKASPESNGTPYYSGLQTDKEVQGFSGTIVTANKPIAVYGGSVGTTVSTAFPRSTPQHQIEQLIPTNRWSTQFLAQPFYHKATYQSDMGTIANVEGHIESYFRIVAAYDGTWVRLNGELAGVLKRGQYMNLPGHHRSQLTSSIQQAHIESNLPIQVTQYSLKNSSNNLLIGFQNYQEGDDLIYLGLADFGNLMTQVPGISQFITGNNLTTPVSSSTAPPSIINSVFDHNYLNIITSTGAVGDLRLNGAQIDSSRFSQIQGTSYSGGSIKVGSGIQNLTSLSNNPFGVTSYGFSRQDYLQIFPYGFNGYGYPTAITLPALSKPKANSPPQISISNLQNKGRYLSLTAIAQIPIFVTTNDLDGSVARVEYQVFQSTSGPGVGTNIYSDIKGWKDIIPQASQTVNTTPFETILGFDTTRTGRYVGSSYYTIRATAYDDLDAASTTEITIQVDSPANNLAPEVRVKSPDFSIVGGGMLVSRRGPPAPTSIPVEAEVADPNNNLAAVTFKLFQGGVQAKNPIDFGPTGPFQGTFTDVAEGVYTLQIIATDSLGATTQQDVTVFVQGTVPTSSARRINAGGGNYTPSATPPAPTSGAPWLADNSFLGGVVNLDTQTITGTSDPGLYQSARTLASQTSYYGSYTPSGGFQYVFALLPNQKATVNLHFADRPISGSSGGGGGGPPYGGYGGTNPRVFHVIANDGSYLEDYLLTNFNIEAQAGGMRKALVKTVSAYADENGYLTLSFINDPAVLGLDPYLVINGQTIAATGSAPIVSAIEVVPVVDEVTCDNTGNNVTGNLDPTDESMTMPGTGGSFWADRYKLKGLNGKNVTLSVTSGAFAPKVLLLAPEGYVVASSDNGSSLSWTLDRDGQYTVVVSSQVAGATGAYTLTLGCSDNVVNPPAAPSNLTARTVSNPRQLSIDSIELRWQDNSLNEQKFRISRSIMNPDQSWPNFIPVGFAEASPGMGGQVVWRETGTVATEKVYRYKVEAMKGTSGAESNIAKVNTYIIPPTVSILSPTDRTRATTNPTGNEVSSNPITIVLSASAAKGHTIDATGVELLENGLPVTTGVSVTRDDNVNRKNRYTITWTGAPTGDRRISVRVTDSVGVSSTSAAQWLTVGSATPLNRPKIVVSGNFNNGPKAISISTGDSEQGIPPTPDTTVYYTISYAGETAWPVIPGAQRVIKYTGPFVLFRNATIRAKAFRGNLPASLEGSLIVTNLTFTPIAQPGNNFGTIAKQPDAYFNQLPSKLTDTQRTYFKTATPGVEIFTGRAKFWGAISGANVASWTLYYRPLEQDERAKSFDAEKGWRPLTSGVGAQPLGQLGEFDTTMLSNGQYEFKLRVYNLNYDPANPEALLDPNNPDLGKNYSDTFRTALVQGGQKSGPFTLSLNDLTLPAPGFPIQIARTYDSTDKSLGDFGIGWRLAVNNVKVQASATAIAAPSSGYPYGGGTTSESGRTRALGDGWSEKYSPILQTYYLVADEPHYLTISLPTGETYGFYAMLTSETASVPFDQLNNFELPKVHFKPIPGTMAERHQAPSEYIPGARLYAVLTDGTVTDTVPVEISSDGSSSSQNGVRTRRLQLLESDNSGGYGSSVLEVKNWLLVTRAGAKFYFNTERGLTKMVDTNGNEISYEYGQVTDSAGQSRGWRIGTIRSFRNTASGPVETRSLSLGWGTDGYINQITDPAGSTIVYTRNAAGDLISVKNRTNDVVSYAYDNQHNLIQLQSPQVVQPGEATVQPTVYNKYDESGKLVATLDADGNATVTSHYPSERRTVITAPTGEQSLLAYDDVGNVLLTAKYAVEADGTTRPITTETSYKYWRDGSNTSPNPLSKFANLPTEQKTQIGHDPDTGEIRPQDIATQTFIYDTDNFYKMGDLIKTIDALGNASTMRYDAYGHVIETRDPTRQDEGMRPNVRTIYDPLTGNLLQTKTALNATTTMEYGADGQPTKTVDALGNATSVGVEYTNIGGQVIMTKTTTLDALNHKTEIVYGTQANGFNAGALGLKTEQRVTRTNPITQQPETIVTKFEYDAEGRVTKTISPDNRTSQTVYNAQGRAWKRIDSNGRESKTIYDGKGRVVKSIDPLGRTSTTSYDAAGRVIQTVSSTGATTTQEYNALGQVVKTTSTVPNPTYPNQPVVTTSRSEYDDAGRVSKSFDTQGRPSGTSEYDKNGQVTKSWNPAHTLELGSYAYDDAGKSKWSKDARGAYSIPIYDAEGRVLKSYGGLMSLPPVDVDGNYILTGLKPLGETFYDSLGRAIIERDGAGRTKAFQFDVVGRLVKVIQVMNTTALPTDLNASSTATVAAYNMLVGVAPGTGLAPDPNGSVHPHQITTYAYDELGNKVSQVDAKGRETTFQYDKLGRLVKRTMPNLQAETMAYDTNGRLASKTDFRGKTTTFHYDTTSITSPNYGKLLEKRPDATLGEPSIFYSYDANPGVNQGKRVAVTYGGTALNFTYDLVKGQLTSVATLLGGVQMGAVGYTYNPVLGMKTGTTTYLGTSASGTNTFEYDEEDRLWKVGNTAITTGPLATYSYNENGSLKSVTRPSAVSTYEYSAKNELLWINHQSGNGSDLKSASRFYYQTDDSGKRVAIHDGTQTTGNASSGVSPLNGATGGTRYTYDLAGRLEKEEIPAAAGVPNKVIFYTYDKVGNRISRTETLYPVGGSPSATTATYSYTRTENPSAPSDVPDLARYGTGQAAIDVYKASYASNDWLWKETRGDGTSVYYDYDANGAVKYERTFSPGGVLVRLSELRFFFDGKLDRQVFWEPGTSTMVTSQTLYNYDGDGNRVGLQRQQLGSLGMSYGVVTSENHDYLVDTSQPYAEVIQERVRASNASGTQIGDSLIYRYDIGLDRLHYFKYQIPANANGPSLGSPFLSEWLLFDGLGSTRALVENDGKVADEFGYNDAFGIPYRVVVNPITNQLDRAVAPAGFFLNGQQWDGGSGWGGSIWSGSPAFNSGEGLYFNRARYYQPGLGRFVGEDPVIGNIYEPVTLQRYGYSSNDPVSLSDPSGKNFTIGGVIAAIGGVLTIANAIGVFDPHPANAPTSTSDERIVNTPTLLREVQGVIIGEIGGRIFTSILGGIFKAITRRIAQSKAAKIDGEVLFMRQPSELDDIAGDPDLSFSDYARGEMSMEELITSGKLPTKGDEGLVITDRHISYSDLYKISKSNDRAVEIMLTREVVDGKTRFVLRSGTVTTSPVPYGVWPIAHTHPGFVGALDSTSPSRQDFFVLNKRWFELGYHKKGNNFSRPSTIIFGENPGQTTIFFSEAEKYRFRDPE